MYLYAANPVYSGWNIYSLEPGDLEFTVTVAEYQIQVRQVKVLDVKSNNKLLLNFLNNGLRNLMTKLKYMSIAKSGTFFNSKKVDKIDDLSMYSGYKANFLILEKGIYLRVDTAKKIVRNQTVLQFINEIYRNNASASKEEKRELVKQSLINKIIMTNYGKPRYVKVEDIVFLDMDTTFIPGTEMTIREYYSNKYNIKIENARQPLLVIEERRNKVLFYLSRILNKKHIWSLKSAS